MEIIIAELFFFKMRKIENIFQLIQQQENYKNQIRYQNVDIGNLWVW